MINELKCRPPPRRRERPEAIELVIRTLIRRADAGIESGSHKDLAPSCFETWDSLRLLRADDGERTLLLSRQRVAGARRGKRNSHHATSVLS